MTDEKPSARSGDSSAQREQPEWVPIFLKRLSEGAAVVEACRSIGIDESTPYKHRDKVGRDSEFAQDWSTLVAYRDDSIEDCLGDYMRNGVPEDVWFNGMMVGKRRVIDAKAMLAYLKARRPQQWSERRIDQGSGESGPKIQINFAAQPETPPDTTKDPD